MSQYNALPAKIKKYMFPGESGFYEGVSRDASVNMVRVALHRNANERFYFMGP